MRRPRIRFWQKVLAALVIVGVAPIALVSVVSTNNTRNDLTLLGVTNIRQRSTSTANAIDAYLASRLGDIILVAKLPDIIRYATNLGDQESRAIARTALAAAAARAPEYESVAVVDPKGTIVAASVPTDEGTSVAFREYFLTAMKGTPYVSDPSYSVITNKPALFFSSPVAAGGVVVAVVRTRVNLAAIWDIVESDAGSVGVGAHSFLVDDYGIRLAVSETKGHRDQAESLIYKPIAPIDADTAKKLAADKRVGTITPDKLVIEAAQVSARNIDLREARFDTRSGDDNTHEVASAFDRMLNALRFYALADEAGSGGEE